MLLRPTLPGSESRCSTLNFRRGRARLALAALIVLSPLVAQGCKKAEVVEELPPDYARQLGPGESALRKLGPNDPPPDLAAAFSQRDPLLLSSIDQSMVWFRAPSSQQFFPFEDICTHEQAQASLVAMRQLMLNSTDSASFEREFLRLFDIYQTVGYNGQGVVLFTGYYSPEFRASRFRAPGFEYPIYRRPADLVTDPTTGAPLGRRMPDGSTQSYPSREEIETTRMLEGGELAWLESDFDAYIVHVNGSAKLRLPDNSIMHVGYAGKTDREYVGLGKSMVEEGLVDKNKLSLAAVRDYYQRDPETVRRLIRKNESFVFFQEYDGANWPSGSLGVRVTEKATVATDKKIYPRGGVVMLDTKAANFGGSKEPFKRFVLDQDTGGAIKAPGRADIYMGVGAAAEILAGAQYNEGTLFYFFLKPEYVAEYAAQIPSGPVRTGGPERENATGGRRTR